MLWIGILIFGFVTLPWTFWIVLPLAIVGGIVYVIVSITRMALAGKLYPPKEK